MLINNQITHKPSLQVKRETFPCPVCESTSYRVLYKPTRPNDNIYELYGAASSIRGTQTIVKCQECSMIYENPRFSEALILEGYRASSEASHDSQFEMRVQSFERAIQRIQAYLPKRRNWLDIGCAGGGFVKAAIRRGFNIKGVEPSRHLVECAQSKLLPVVEGSLETHPYEREKFSVISLWDVLEHMANPGLAFQKARRQLEEEGMLLINIPDIGTAMAKVSGRRFWWFLSGHLHYFTAQTLDRLALKHGFERVYKGRYWQTLELGYLFQMAAHLGVPLANQVSKLLPTRIKRIKLSYYASQTLFLYRRLSHA